MITDLPAPVSPVTATKAGRELPVEFLDQCEVLDAQRGERCEHGARV